MSLGIGYLVGDLTGVGDRKEKCGAGGVGEHTGEGLREYIDLGAGEYRGDDSDR